MDHINLILKLWLLRDDATSSISNEYYDDEYYDDDMMMMMMIDIIWILSDGGNVFIHSCLDFGITVIIPTVFKRKKIRK